MRLVRRWRGRRFVVQVDPPLMDIAAEHLRYWRQANRKAAREADIEYIVELCA